jgi:hypothetical protein
MVQLLKLGLQRWVVFGHGESWVVSYGRADV